MSLSVRRLFESFPAHLADVRSLARVGPQVDVQPEPVLEGFPTEATCDTVFNLWVVGGTRLSDTSCLNTEPKVTAWFRVVQLRNQQEGLGLQIPLLSLLPAAELLLFRFWLLLVQTGAPLLGPEQLLGQNLLLADMFLWGTWDKKTHVCLNDSLLAAS